MFLVELIYSAGDYQVHVIKNVFNVLGNAGFFRDQGILSLGSVQNFYEKIEEEPRNATQRVSNLLDFCDQPGHHELPHKPVITLTHTSSTTGVTQGHAVVLDKYDRDEDCLVLTTIDSNTESGQTIVLCPILIRNGCQKLVTRGETDKWCLGSDKCYVFYFN